MKPRVLLFKVALCGLVMVLAAAMASAATVRGRLIHKNGSPAAGIEVSVVGPQGARSVPVRTGADGMYYLFNLPPGSYRLEIWVYPGGAPLVYQIQVRDPYTDIAQIGVP
ncbi:MAG: carboxypeptidase-like regulatory domain-containing protein [Terracidiphilus sp.]|jgi:hypothetical protein